MSSEILIIEDDADIADSVDYMLRDAGFVTRIAHDGDVALNSFRREKPDLVVLDLGLPGIDGLELFSIFRKEVPDIAIIIATARADEQDRITGLGMGADDYISKPFSVAELVLRVQAVLRRIGVSADDSRQKRFGKLVLKLEELRVEYAGEEVKVSPLEFRLLECLVEHPAWVYSRDSLMNHIYANDPFVGDRAIDAQVKRIRSAFGKVNAAVNPIRTVYGGGYKLGLDGGGG
jgi:DNA-binding response OmpR family regulator